MPQLPNIIWLVADHQNHLNPSQNLSYHPLQLFLRSAGMTFTEARTVLPVCSPARASMLTGLYPHAHGLTENDGRFGGRSGLSLSDWMIHHQLMQLGYRCSWFGKWHVDNKKNAQDYGFEGWSLPGYGYPYSTPAYRNYLDRARLNEPVIEVEIPGESGMLPGSRINLCDAKNWFDYEAGSAFLEGDPRTHEAYFVADLASKWMGELGERPFFLRVDTWGPHPPYLVGEHQRQMDSIYDISLPGSFYSQLEHRPKHHRDYRDEWQDCLGLNEEGWKRMYLRALQQAQLVEHALLGLIRNVDFEKTLVIFTTDHGDAVGTNGGTANKGGLMTEATLRIPLLFAGPGITPQSQSEARVSNMDIVATLMDLIGCHDMRLHSRSLLPLITSKKSDAFESVHLSQHNGLHVHLPQRAWYDRDWKLVVQADGFLELYHLAADPDELHNLASSEAHRHIVNYMMSGLSAKMSELGDDFGLSRAFDIFR